MRCRALAPPVIVLLLAEAAAHAQRAVPADCPQVYDARGVRLGPIVGTGIGVGEKTLYYQAVNETAVTVAMAVGNEVFHVSVLKNHLMGTKMNSDVLAYFATPDCSGQPYSAVTEDGTVGGWPSFRDEDIGPVPVTAVIGPNDTVWAFDSTLAPQTFTEQSFLRYDADDPRTEECRIPATPDTFPARPLRRLADLSPDYQTPFHVENGPCPRPGRR